MTAAGGPRQLTLDLDHAESYARDDFLGGPSNAAALTLIDSWPDWPNRIVLLVGPASAQQAHVNLDWNPHKNTQNLTPYGANLVSPEVRDDRTVTFRLKAPDARTVALTGGPIQAVMRDQMTGRARGFAFVEMMSDEGAQKAIDQLNNTDLGGRALAVNEARPKAPRTGGFDDGGGRGRSGGGGGFGGNRRREPRW